MTLTDHIDDVGAGLREQRYPNESAISQGIVLRLLGALGWPTYDTRVVWPEYMTEGQRVDFALCHPAGTPLVFVEVKQTGKGVGADEQLFKYLLKGGIPLAVMTDGREWHFYLPGGSGSYEDRRFYLLDLLERNVEESTARLTRYLAYDDAKIQRTVESAWKDYRDISTAREIERHLPAAWARLLTDADEALAAVLAEKVESLSGYKPSPERIAQFLRQQAKNPGPGSLPPPLLRPLQPPDRGVAEPSEPVAPTRRKASPASLSDKAQRGYTLNGVFHDARNAADVYRRVIAALMNADSGFAERFSMEGGRTRAYLARDRELLFPGRADLQEQVAELPGGWYLGLNLSRQSIERRIQTACGLARFRFGKDLTLHL